MKETRALMRARLLESRAAVAPAGARCVHLVGGSRTGIWTTCNRPVEAGQKFCPRHVKRTKAEKAQATIDAINQPENASALNQAIKEVVAEAAAKMALDASGRRHGAGGRFVKKAQ